jgi:predicted ester cyclase
MSVEENKILIRHYFGMDIPPEIVKKRQEINLTREQRQAGFRAHFESIFSPDFICHDSNNEWNREQSITMNLRLYTGFSNLTFSMDKMVAEEDLVVVVGKMRGIHQGTYAGIPATGKTVEIRYTSTYRITKGQVVEAWSSMDWMGLMQQIGAIPMNLLTIA